MTGFRRLYFFLVALFLAAPLIVVLGVSVNEKQDLAFPPVGFSLAWYAQIFTDPGWRNASQTIVAERQPSCGGALPPGRMCSSCSGWRRSSCRR